MGSETHTSTPIGTGNFENQGLRITLRETVDNLNELLERRIVTRQMLERHGFVVVEGAGGRPEARADEDTVRGETSLQFFHRDRPSHPDPSVLRVVTLRYPANEPPRTSATMIGDARPVLRETAKFLVKNPPPVHHRMVELRDEFAALGIDGIGRLDPRSMRPDGKTWSNRVFSEIAVEVGASNYERMPALYAHLDRILHQHRWQAGQLLLINDNTMVHGRFPIATEAGGGRLFRRQLDWKLRDEQLDSEEKWLNNFENLLRPCSRRPDLPGSGFAEHIDRYTDRQLALFAAIDDLMRERGATYEDLRLLREQTCNDAMSLTWYRDLVHFLYRRLRRAGFLRSELIGVG